MFRRVIVLALLLGSGCSYDAMALPPGGGSDSATADAASGDADASPDVGTDSGEIPDAGPDGAVTDTGIGVDTAVPTTFRSCKEIRDAVAGATSRAYTITPNPGGGSYDVYCEMDTDGGGWTLVTSSRGDAPADVRSGHYADLATLDPATAHRVVADLMRPVITDRSDMRFACKSDPASADMRVDLSFYDVPWYRTVTTGTDAESCFSENDGAGYERPAPARRNNIDGMTRPLGDDWDAGYLEGEDSCGSPNDFAIDFDDRGGDGNESDGTDWGDDDSSNRCGVDGLSDGIWYLFVRE